MKPDYLQTTEEVLSTQGSSSRGLTGEEAAARLSKHGPNRLQEAKKITNFQRFVQQLKDPMLLILLAAAAVSAVTSILSHESLTEVFIILVVVLLNAVLGVVQESKAEAAIEALQTMTAATSKVLRGGRQVTLKSEQLVPGDVVVLEAGDAVPADARVLESASLRVEEAALTGESVPVEKHAGALAAAPGAKDVPLGDRRNMVYMGSTVVYGRGQAVVTGTGMHTEMGKIATALEAAQDGQTPLQKKLFLQGRRTFYTLLFILWVIQPFKHHHAQNCKAGTQHKTDCPQRHAEQNAHGNAEQDACDLTFLHFTALPFRTMQRTAATREHTAPEPPPALRPAPAANRWRAGCCSKRCPPKRRNIP